MSTAITVREARSGESQALAEAVIAQPLFTRHGVAAADLARGMAAGQASGDGLLVAEDEVVRGFAWFQPRGGLALGGYLRLIALVPGQESRGVGAALLDEVERRVPGRHMFLLVSGFNEAAQRFYARRGYVERGRLPGLLKPEIDEVLMYRRLRD
ncbi:MAG: GNAT family N-acetyltransferase [Polyangia bacterium]